ncbi:hypothetical protein C8R44DRAFT_144727 [Mycena epipterygia]|nr:hypothetical protein C8R44DRAFT_144727 [Mycena epipterygia]
MAFGKVFELRFKPTQGTDTAHNYRWTGINARGRSFNPSPTHGNTLNQATFIHGLSISLGKGIWGRLFGDVKICEIMDYQLGNSAGESGSRPQGSSVFSWSLRTFGGGSASGGKQHACPGEEVLLSDSPPVSKIFHPAEIINNYILEKSPNATVVMSHDDDWPDILQDVGWHPNHHSTSSRVVTAHKRSF